MPGSGQALQHPPPGQGLGPRFREFERQLVQVDGGRRDVPLIGRFLLDLESDLGDYCGDPFARQQTLQQVVKRMRGKVRQADDLQQGDARLEGIFGIDRFGQTR